MAFGSQGYVPFEQSCIPATELTEDSAFYQVRTAARAVVGTHRHEQFITDFYAEVMSEPRDYSGLLGELKKIILSHRYEVQEGADAQKTLRYLWHQIGSEVQISGKWYNDFMEIITTALRACPPSDQIYYRRRGIF
jgi:hypothetical protein